MGSVSPFLPNIKRTERGSQEYAACVKIMKRLFIVLVKNTKTLLMSFFVVLLFGVMSTRKPLFRFVFFFMLFDRYCSLHSVDAWVQQHHAFPIFPVHDQPDKLWSGRS